MPLRSCVQFVNRELTSLSASQSLSPPSLEFSHKSTGGNRPGVYSVGIVRQARNPREAARECVMAGDADYLSSLSIRMAEFGLRVSSQVSLPDGPTVDLFGSRTYFSWKGLVLISQHVAVRDCTGTRPTAGDAKELFEAGFRQAKRVNRVPLLRGMQFGYMIVPCLVVRAADPALIEYAESRPPKHWSLFEFPVIVDRSTGQTHYYNHTALWGGFYFSDMRKLASTCFGRADR